MPLLSTVDEAAVEQPPAEISRSALQCPLCALHGRRGNSSSAAGSHRATSGLHKVQISQDPLICITVCRHPDCVFTDTAQLDCIQPAGVSATQEKWCAAINSVLFSIRSCSFVTKQRMNPADPTYEMMCSEQFTTDIDEQSFLSDLKLEAPIGTEECYINVFLKKITSFSHSLRTYLSFHTEIYAQCSEKCSTERCTDYSSESHFRCTDFTQISFRPSLRLSWRSKCTKCQLSDSIVTARFIVLSDLLIITSPNGIVLPQEKCFIWGNESFRLASVVVESDQNACHFIVYTCGHNGQLQSQFHSEYNVSAQIKKTKLINLQPASIRMVVFEKIDFGIKRTESDSSIPSDMPVPDVSSGRKRKPSTSPTGSVRSTYSKSSTHSSERRSPSQSSSSSSKLLKSSEPSAAAFKAPRLARKRFAGYTSRKDRNANDAPPVGHTADSKPSASAAISWYSHMQKQLSMLPSMKKEKITAYLATLQSLNVDIAWSQSELLSRANTPPPRRGGAPTVSGRSSSIGGGGSSSPATLLSRNGHGRLSMPATPSPAGATSRRSCGGGGGHESDSSGGGANTLPCPSSFVFNGSIDSELDAILNDDSLQPPSSSFPSATSTQDLALANGGPADELDFLELGAGGGGLQSLFFHPLSVNPDDS